jgi:hypothetical protein
VPAGMINEPRGHSIMAPDQPEENETRLVMDAGSVRLVVMINDLFAADPRPLAEAVTRQTQSSTHPVRVEALVLSTGLTGVAVIPAKLECDQEACLVSGAYLRTAEGELEYAAVYVNPAGASEESAARALAARILGSIGAGKKTLPLAAEERGLLGFGDRGILSATLPGNTAVSIEHGPDFTVIRLHLLKSLDAPPASLGIYVGGFPSFHPGRGAASREVTLLGEKSSWFSHPGESKGFLQEEALVRFREEGMPYIHLFLGGDEGSIPALEAIATSLRFAPRSAGK